MRKSVIFFYKTSLFPGKKNLFQKSTNSLTIVIFIHTPSYTTCVCASAINIFRTKYPRTNSCVVEYNPLPIEIVSIVFTSSYTLVSICIDFPPVFQRFVFFYASLCSAFYTHSPMMMVAAVAVAAVAVAAATVM